MTETEKIRMKGWIAYLENQKDTLEVRAQYITTNMLEDGITGIQRELIEFSANVVCAPWVDIIKSADYYAERIRNILKEREPKFYPGDVIKCASNGSLWVRCKGGPNIRSDGHTVCIGGGYELASKEEAVQFFQELNENGYQWDCIEGRPMRKEQKPISGSSEKPNNQWNEVDEDNLQRAINICVNDFGEDCETAKFLKSLPERFSPQPEQEWSEEDEQIFRKLVHRIETLNHYCGADPLWDKTLNWLKSLRPQPDRNLAASFMDYLDEHRPEGKMCLSNGECADIETAFKENDWAKVIRYVNKYQPHWKPSEEQMNWLATAVRLSEDKPAIRPIVESLYDDLKKL